MTKPIFLFYFQWQQESQAATTNSQIHRWRMSTAIILVATVCSCWLPGYSSWLASRQHDVETVTLRGYCLGPHHQGQHECTLYSLEICCVEGYKNHSQMIRMATWMTTVFMSYNNVPHHHRYCFRNLSTGVVAVGYSRRPLPGPWIPDAAWARVRSGGNMGPGKHRHDSLMQICFSCIPMVMACTRRRRGLPLMMFWMMMTTITPSAVDPTAPYQAHGQVRPWTEGEP
jgi:hypothetical protein